MSIWLEGKEVGDQPGRGRAHGSPSAEQSSSQDSQKTATLASLKSAQRGRRLQVGAGALGWMLGEASWLYWAQSTHGPKLPPRFVLSQALTAYGSGGRPELGRRAGHL